MILAKSAMTISSQSYFAALRDYLNIRHYSVTEVDDDIVTIKDKIFVPGRADAIQQKVRLQVSGEAIVINLDKKNSNGNSDPLFHFLENESKPWARRCDFVIFHLHRNKIFAYCFEFKSGTFPDGLVDQMNSGMAWCRSLHSVIKHYTGKSKRLHISKYVLSCHESPERFLDATGKYLKKDHTIRHYLYSEIDGMSLESLENAHVEAIG
jgi:hypothetical protein